MGIKISIIVATYNGEKFLVRFLNSVINQEYKNFELIIIDGGSTDSTVDILKQFEKYIHYWISEPDEGIYDAWNKGLEESTGDWIMFLGCDDSLLSDALVKYSTFINKQPNSEQLEFVSSRVQMMDRNWKPVRIRGFQYEWPLFLKKMTVAHPGALHSKRLFEKYGKYNIEYKIVGDYELLLRGGKQLRSAFMDAVTVFMSEEGTSDSVEAIKEQYKAVTKTGGYRPCNAFANAVVVYFKFKTRKVARKAGLNVFLCNS